MDEARQKRFLEVVRMALLEVVYWIEREYKLPPPTHYRRMIERQLYAESKVSTK